MYKKIGKRFIDFSVSLMTVMILSPLLVILTITGFFVMKGNPFFVQERPGRNEKIFKMVKFRTMTNAKDENGNFLPDQERFTSYGKILRSTSLDELPEFFNIIKGDMSIVGPRPLLVRYLPYYTEEESIRHSVRPGLTGLAQVKGRNNLPWNDRLKMDIEYVQKLSFAFDIQIIFMTIKKVFFREDVVEAGKYTILDLDVERRK